MAEQTVEVVRNGEGGTKRVRQTRGWWTPRSGSVGGAGNLKRGARGRAGGFRATSGTRAGRDARSEGEAKSRRGDPGSFVQDEPRGPREDGRDQGREPPRSKPVRQTDVPLPRVVRP